jgi:hypothetical protein
VSTSPGRTEQKTRAVSELPVDELIVYGQDLGLPLTNKMGHGEMLRLVRERQELLVQLDRRAMLDIVVWARHPVRQSASKEQLAKEIASIRKMDFRALSDAGLITLAQLRNVKVMPSDPRAMIEARLRDAEPFWDRVRRRRRRLMGAMISRMLQNDQYDEEEDYRFLPEDPHAASLKEQIAEEGVVGGIARKIRGVADDYVREKLDEIESRIDSKLDEIDARLSEWRDREIANRLKIIKITLVASVLVALLSYVYSHLTR